MTIKNALEELLQYNINSVIKIISRLNIPKDLKFHIVCKSKDLMLIDNKYNLYFYKKDVVSNLGLDYESQKKFMLEFLSGISTYVIDEDTFNKNEVKNNERELKIGYLHVVYIDDIDKLLSNDIKRIEDIRLLCKIVKIYFEPNLKKPLKKVSIDII